MTRCRPDGWTVPAWAARRGAHRRHGRGACDRAAAEPRRRQAVAIRGEYAGIAYHLLDVVEFLRRAGLPESDTTLDDPGLIEWRGGGPEAWAADE